MNVIQWAEDGDGDEGLRMTRVNHACRRGSDITTVH
jgi:hypothetical protein